MLRGGLSLSLSGERGSASATVVPDTKQYTKRRTLSMFVCLC